MLLNATFKNRSKMAGAALPTQWLNFTPTFAGMVCLLFVFSKTSFAADDLPARQQQVAQMSPKELAELRQKKERFESLKPEEQARLRQMNDQLAADSQGERLKAILERYDNWLASLPAGQRSELLSLPTDKRLVEIKRLLKEQEEQQFRRLVEGEPQSEDLRVVFRWLEDFVQRHEAEIIAELPKPPPEFVKKLEDANKRPMAIYMRYLFESEKNHKEPIQPEESDFKVLEEQLSPEIRRFFANETTLQKKRQLIRTWIQASFQSRMFPKVSKEELEDFYAHKLSAEDRDRLAGLSGERLLHELRHLYARHQFRQQRGGDGRPGFFGPPPSDKPSLPREKMKERETP